MSHLKIVNVWSERDDTRSACCSKTDLMDTLPGEEGGVRTGLIHHPHSFSVMIVRFTSVRIMQPTVRIFFINGTWQMFEC
jgi:hypothetical protein